MRRLSIIDLVGGDQPIWNEDGTIGVVFNGEIYNYVELRQELIGRGHRFRTASDTEVLVHLYEELGEGLTSRLRGMFAFCILDQRDRSLFLARDHFGQKPLYYSTGVGFFGFASELKSLFELPWVERDLDEGAFLDYCAWLSLPPPRTHFRNIKKLAAGSQVKIALDSLDVMPKRYWQYDLYADPDLNDLDSAIEALDAAIKDSVSVHLRSDVPIGILLSGGVDSRTVLTYTKLFRTDEIHSFSIGFGAADSELVAAAATARALGSQHHEINVSAEDFATSLDRTLYHLDEPISDPACFAVLSICELARSEVKVLLSGEGSDELLAGYEGRYAGLISSMQRTLPFRWIAPILPSAKVHASSRRYERFLARARSSPGGETAMLRICGLPGDVRNPEVLTSDQLSELYERTEVVGNAVYRRQPDLLSSQLTFDIDWNLGESLLQKADKMSMGAGIELRTPLLDILVADVAARISSSLKLPSGGPGKYVLRCLLERRGDASLIRPKKGFPVPIAAWMRGPLREKVQQDLFAQNSIVCSLLERRPLLEAWEDFIADKTTGVPFFSLWLYERWRHQLAERCH
jgi:asparagine synthase (glutamine-hydrolysing)